LVRPSLMVYGRISRPAESSSHLPLETSGIVGYPAALRAGVSRWGRALLTSMPIS
jgi:hypothetical protein